MEQPLDPYTQPVGAIATPSKSAVSWPAIIAGAAVAAAATLFLFALGSGIGFASISPWPNRGVSISAFAMSTAIWLIVTQWISAALGGYIAGRMRTRWIGTHVHEVFFRDTAHGLVTWAVATVLIVSVAAGSLVSGVGGGTHAVSGAVSATAAGAPPTIEAITAYGMDKLYRTGNSAAPTTGADPRLETGRLMANALANGGMPDSDRAYLVDQVVARTGVSQVEAQTRVNGFVAAVMDGEAKLKAAADAARKAAAEASIYLALSMLVGAFIASVSAALGGRLRDEHI